MMLIHRFGPGFGGPGWFVGGVLPTLLLLVLIGVLVWAVLRSTSAGRATAPAAALPPAPRKDPALEEVRLRYARGEMSREEYVERSRDLGGSVPEPGEPPPPAAE